MDADVDRPDSAQAHGADGAAGPEAGKRKKRGGGPKTAEGKRRSAANSTKFGLRATVILPAEIAAACKKHKASLIAEFKPETSYLDFLVDEMALTMAQLDRCATLLLVDLELSVESATFDWDDERRTAAEKLGKRLPTDVSFAAHALEQTVQGIDWKTERWEGFRMGIAHEQVCSEDLRSLAFDLMGVPVPLRSAPFKVPAATDIPGLMTLANREIARLQKRKEGLVAHRDESRRKLAMQGMAQEEHPNTTQLRRYHGMLTGKLKWAEKKLCEARDLAATLREQPRDRTETTAASAPRGPAANAPEAPRNHTETTAGTPRREPAATTSTRTGAGNSFTQGALSPGAAVEFNLRRLEAFDREVLAQWKADRAKAAARAADKAAEGTPPSAKPAEGAVACPMPAAPVNDKAVAGAAGPAVATARIEATHKATTPAAGTRPAASGATSPAATAAHRTAAPLNRFQQADEKRRARKAAIRASKDARRAQNGG